MHIVILADPIDNQRAGVHTYTKNLIEGLLKIDRENSYTFIHQEENDFFRDLDHHVLRRKNILAAGTYRKFIEIPKLLKKLNPDIVIETCHIGPFFTPKNCKKVTIIHDLTPILFPHFHIKRSSLVHKLLLKKVIKDANLIITPSENSKKDILNYQKTPAQVAVIPPGIKIPKAEDNQLIKFLKTGRPLSGSKQAKTAYLLYLGTIEPRKNIELLIEAFDELKLPGYKLVIAGEIGWKSEQIIEKASVTPNVELTGFIDEVAKAKLLKNATLFIYPSLYEGFGIPPLEAMSYGTPVIVSQGGALKDIYENHAVTFNPSDKSDLKDKIQSLLNQNPSLKFINDAKKYASSFNWERAAQKTLGYLNNL